MMPFLRRKQASAARFASSFTPATAAGLTFRNLITRLLRVPFLADLFVGRELHDDIEIPEYEFQRLTSRAHARLARTNLD